MSKAFTHLCRKINISLYKDTLTIYPKSNITHTQAHDELSQLMFSLFSQMDCMVMNVDAFFEMRANELGIRRYIDNNDSQHHLYHQDNFDRNNTHIHAQFEKTIDATKFKDILKLLKKHSLISAEEYKHVIIAYREANTLDSTVSKKHDKEQEKSTQLKSDAPTYAGFRKGFFNTSTATTMKKDAQQAQPHDDDSVSKKAVTESTQPKNNVPATGIKKGFFNTPTATTMKKDAQQAQTLEMF